MSIDPKKAGQCWSCKYSEDIASAESGPYYRKCTKSGHEYVDKCEFSCRDYVWDGKTDEFFKEPEAPVVSVSSAEPATASASSEKVPAKKSGGVFKLVSAVITTAIFAFLGYLTLEYSKYLLTVMAGGTATLPFISDPYTLEMVVILVPFALTIVWSIIRRRKIWVGALLTLIGCVAVNSVLGEETTPAHMPLFYALIAVCFLLCLFAILKGKKSAEYSGSGASYSSGSSSSSASAPAQRTYKDYECYQCSYYRVDADYNGICGRTNGLVDRYKSACSGFVKK